MWGDRWKIYPEDVFFCNFFLDTSNIYNRFCYLEEDLKIPHPYPPIITFKEDIEQGSKITGIHYSGEKGPTMSHKGGG